MHLISKEGPSRLKALIVYDGSETPLKSFYREDGLRMKKNLKVIAKHTKLALTIQSIKASQLSHAMLQAWVTGISPSDTVVFYYAGKPSYVSNDQWPSLGFSCGEAPLSQTQLLAQIKQKEPHLILSLFDCYSKILEKRWRFRNEAPSRRLIDKKAMIRLFVKYSGLISGCSANPGEASVAIRDRSIRGGLFSLGIHDYFQAFRGMESDWSGFRCRVESICLGQSHQTQHPLMQIDVIPPKAHHVVTKRG